MKPRKHHYLVAHETLPLLFYRNPIEFLVRSNEEKDNFVRIIWVKTGEKFIENLNDRLPPTGLFVQPFNQGQIYGAIFVFPEPRAITEAHMTCALGKLRKMSFDNEELDNCRYLTLEHGESVDGSPRTVFCAWEKDGTHLNFGDGPENDIDAFLNKCLSIYQ